MKRNILHIAALIILFASFEANSQYSLESNGGKINNKGTIKVKTGQVKGLPDTLGGRIEFLQKRDASQQSIPNIVYNQLVIKNDAKKVVSDSKDANNQVKPLVVLDSLIISDNANFTTRWIGTNPEDVIARATVLNTAKYEGPKDIRMNNDLKSQDLLGNGNFSRLNIDNPFGVDVRGGGFVIDEQLTLSRGALRNSISENFAMADSTRIIRNVGSNLATSPNFQGRVDVQYVGNGDITSSGELPDNNSSLQVLSQENTGDLYLAKNVIVNDSLFVGNRIFTSNDTITLATAKNPGFNPINPNAEISGTLRLTKLRTDSTKMFLHNPLTYAIFRDAISANGLNELIVTIRPRTFPIHNLGTSKARRSIDIEGFDINGNKIETGMNMLFGYGWRNLPGDSLDESNGMLLSQMILQNWSGSFWNDNLTSNAAKDSAAIGWAFSYASSVTDFGSFAIGSIGGVITFNAKVFLEGAYRFGSMADDLRQRGYLTMPPPDIYPYNLDPLREFYFAATLPDSVVDWVVVEFRKNFTEKGKFRTYLVKQDGKLVDLYGNDALVLSNTGFDSNRIDSGNYYVAIRHRNHLAVVTKEYVGLMPGTTRELDFTSFQNLMGGVNSLKPVEKKSNGEFVYAMIAGEMNGSIFDSGIINDTDFDLVIPELSVWSYPLFNGYLIGDINMDGIITTRDYNMSFNNRFRVSALP